MNSSADCIEESSLTLHGSVSEPDFIIKFSEVSPLAQSDNGCLAETDPKERLTCFVQDGRNPSIIRRAGGAECGRCSLPGEVNSGVGIPAAPVIAAPRYRPQAARLSSPHLGSPGGMAGKAYRLSYGSNPVDLGTDYRSPYWWRSRADSCASFLAVIQTINQNPWFQARFLIGLRSASCLRNAKVNVVSLVKSLRLAAKSGIVAGAAAGIYGFFVKDYSQVITAIVFSFGTAMAVAGYYDRRASMVD